MADDLDPGLRSIEGEGPSPEFVASLRERVLAEAATPTTADGFARVEITPQQEEELPMNPARWMMAGTAAAVIALVVGLVALTGGDDDNAPTPGDEPTEVPTTDAPAVTTTLITEPESAGTPDADADADCGLADSAAVTATVDDGGESVTIDVESDRACSGVEVDVVATPWINGFPIQRSATLDDAGAASVTDHLLGERKGDQDWTVELLVSDTGGVAATGLFTVAGTCDLEAADLQATHLPETDEVDIVLTLDPVCAGETFTFDQDGIFASSGPGGWETYTVDEMGRIEVTEQLVVDRPIIDVFAYPVPEERGVISGYVARVTLDIGD